MADQNIKITVEADTTKAKEAIKDLRADLQGAEKDAKAVAMPVWKELLGLAVFTLIDAMALYGGYRLIMAAFGK